MEILALTVADLTFTTKRDYTQLLSGTKVGMIKSVLQAPGFNKEEKLDIIKDIILAGNPTPIETFALGVLLLRGDLNANAPHFMSWAIVFGDKWYTKEKLPGVIDSLISELKANDKSVKSDSLVPNSAGAEG